MRSRGATRHRHGPLNVIDSRPRTVVRVLQWRRAENVYHSGTPGQVMVMSSTQFYCLPGANPRVDNELCIVNWTITNGIATKYAWQGECRSLQERPGG